MKVNQTGAYWRTSAYIQQKTAPAEKGKVAQLKDRVHISQEAKALLTEQKKAHLVADRSIARAEHVARIKAQIENGTYRVDARQVAERLYDFWFRA